MAGPGTRGRRRDNTGEQGPDQQRENTPPASPLADPPAREPQGGSTPPRSPAADPPEDPLLRGEPPPEEGLSEAERLRRGKVHTEEAGPSNLTGTASPTEDLVELTPDEITRFAKYQEQQAAQQRTRAREAEEHRRAEEQWASYRRPDVIPAARERPPGATPHGTPCHVTSVRSCKGTGCPTPTITGAPRLRDFQPGQHSTESAPCLQPRQRRKRGTRRAPTGSVPSADLSGDHEHLRRPLLPWRLRSVLAIPAPTPSPANQTWSLREEAPTRPPRRHRRRRPNPLPRQHRWAQATSRTRTTLYHLLAPSTNRRSSSTRTAFR